MFQIKNQPRSASQLKDLSGDTKSCNFLPPIHSKDPEKALFPLHLLGSIKHAIFYQNPTPHDSSEGIHGLRIKKTGQTK
jgi:hypothetical protein